MGGVWVRASVFYCCFFFQTFLFIRSIVIGGPGFFSRDLDRGNAAEYAGLARDLM